MVSKMLFVDSYRNVSSVTLRKRSLHKDPVQRITLFQNEEKTAKTPKPHVITITVTCTRTASNYLVFQIPDSLAYPLKNKLYKIFLE